MTRGHPRLADAPIAVKLGLVLVVPLLAVAGFAVAFAARAGPPGDLPRLVAAGAETNALVEALQRERIGAARWLAEGTGGSRSAYVARTAETDRVLAPPAGLADLRTLVLARGPDTPMSTILLRYRAVIADVAAARSEVVEPPTGVDHALRAAAWLAAAQDGLADAQVVGVQALAGGSLTPVAQQAFVAARAAYSENLRQFREHAAADRLDDAFAGVPIRAADALAAQIALTGPEQPLRVDGGISRWVELGGAQFDAVGAVRRDAELAALRAANQATVAGDRTVVLAAGAALGVLLVAVVLAAAVSRSLARAQRQVRRRASAEQEALRVGVSTLFMNLARRSSRLVGGLIEQLDVAERDEADPDRLERLFNLDHLATRMRHANDSLLVLAGSDAARARARAIPLIDLLRAAQSQIEHYQRIEYGRVDDNVAVAPHAVDAVVHALAELFDNATRFSPPERAVFVDGRRTGDGALVQIADRGDGLSDDVLHELNERLRNPPALDVADASAMGLAVVSRLAKRYGLTVELRDATGGAGGIVAVVGLPAAIVTYSAPVRLPPAGEHPVVPRPLERAAALPGGEPIEVPVPRAEQARTGPRGPSRQPPVRAVLPRRAPRNGRALGVAPVPAPGDPAAVEPDEARDLLQSFQSAVGRVESTTQAPPEE
jgi:signal transduction histidine kinase